MSEKWTCLIRIKSADGLRSHMIDKPSFTLGRTQDSDLPILAPSVSRVHMIVEVKEGQLWITDKNSANGTLRNNQLVPPGVATLLLEGDVIKLGTEPDEFAFLALPIPVELQDREERRGSLKESMKDVALQFEMQSQEKVDRELRRARTESEQILAEAKKRVEIQKTQDGIELQARRQQIEAELARLKQDALEEITRERLKSKREADTMITDAQRTIQKDFDEAARKTDLQMSEAHARAVELMTSAEAKAQAALDEAREEAITVRNTASDEARIIHKETVKRGEDMLTEMKAKYTREMNDQKAQALEAARLEARRENELFIATTAKAREELEMNREKIATLEETFAAKSKDFDSRAAAASAAFEEKMTAVNLELEGRMATAKKELADVEQKRKHTFEENQTIRSENERLLIEIKKVTDLEERAVKAERDLTQFTRSYEERKASVEKEFKEMREKRLLDVDNMKREQDNDMARARVKAIDDIKKQIEREEKKYEETKRLRALDLAQLLNAALIPQLSGWVSDAERAPSLMKAAIEKSTIDCIVNTGSVLQSVTVDDGTPAATLEQRDKKNKKYVFAAIAVALIIGIFYRAEIRKMIDESQKNSYGAKVMEDRRIQSIYAPEQDGDYRMTYADNVLYMKGYFDLKSDQKVIEAWTLKLNDLNVIKPMKLTEDDVVHFIAKETNLVQRLGVLRNSIDKVYLSEGLERMRKAEQEDVADIVKILKSDENYRRFRDLEKEFLAEQVKKAALK